MWLGMLSRGESVEVCLLTGGLTQKGKKETHPVLVVPAPPNASGRGDQPPSHCRGPLPPD